MKKLMFSAVIMLTLTSGSAFAQTAPSDLESRVASETREMSRKLSLNESEYIKLKNINHDKMVKADEISNTYKNDESMRNAKLGELQNMYYAQLQSFLSSKQMEAYASYKSTITTYTALEEEKK